MQRDHRMNPQPPDLREEDIFEAALALTGPAERQVYLEGVCRGLPDLRQRIEGLLAASAEAESFFLEGGAAMNQPPLKPAPTRTGLPKEGEVPDFAADEPIGARVGRYKLLQKIGEGGCGVVYLAEQEEPVRRRVALKLIKLGMETQSVIARFEAERQALAMMDHPNIARVLDAGATERGRPYFIMELVRGERITRFCDHQLLDVRRRLELFVQVCHAIQHAHQKGVIHGDIKASNILVSLSDSCPIPKVIDFGISRATEARLSERTLFTLYAQLVGTPAYMSPEQTELGGLDIDTRSDIYSLGVLLYELLTGRTPFESEALLAGGLDNLRRILREVEPPRPSARLRALPAADLQAVAANRCTSVRELASTLEGELDWVVLKALEKDRARRYETANGLAMDVQRYLANETVLARPPSGLYRFRKLVRRNRVLFAAGGAVVAALVAGMSTSTWLLLREREARERAVAAEQQQARLREESELRERITQAALLVSNDRLAEADAMLDTLSLDQPTVEGAAVYRAVGEWHALAGRWSRAADRFQALLRVDQLEGADVTTLDYLRCGAAVSRLGDAARYERFRNEAVARYREVESPFADRIVKICLLAPSSKALHQALDPLVKLNARYCAEAEARGDVFEAAWRALSLSLWELRSGRPQEAEVWAQRCLAAVDNNVPRAATARTIVALALHAKGETVRARSELAKAREAIQSRRWTSSELGSPVQGFWFDRQFAEVLYAEATAHVDRLHP